LFTYIKLIDSKSSSEPGIRPVNLLELNSLKEKDDYYDKETIMRVVFLYVTIFSAIVIKIDFQLTKFLNFPFRQ